MYISTQYKEFLSNLQEKERESIRPAIPIDSFENQHKYELTQEEIDQIFSKIIYQQVINSSAFQRLKKIHFLGSIDYVIDPEGPKPNKRHTRYQHSIGVARLALQFSREKKLTEKEEILCVVSGLLHDIGHAPLSHSLESVFKQEYGLSHHVVSEKIIRGDIPIGRDLHNILLSWNINPFEILEIINGTGSFPYREIFSYSINIDTIEAILRSSTYIYERAISWPPSKILNALLKRDTEATAILDSFWRLKDEVYHKLINHRMGILADYICQQYMKDRKSSFFEDYFYDTESELRNKHPNLFSNLKMLASMEPGQLLPYTNEITYVDRRFHIDENVTLASIRSVDLRYTQTRSEKIYQLKS